jgi:CRISPR-associated protein Cas5d
MGYGICLHVFGDYACFTRPEFKAERVSYDVMTASAARGVVEAIYFKPAIKWTIDQICVLKPIRFLKITRNEVSKKINANNVLRAMGCDTLILHQNAVKERLQRSALVLRDVGYIIKAHFELTEKAGETDTVEKHYNIAVRRMKKGQCFYRPYLGCREFPAEFRLIENDCQMPRSELHGEAELGAMLWDIDYKHGDIPVFFQPWICDGVIKIPSFLRDGSYDS